MNNKKNQNWCHHYEYLPFTESDLQSECKYCKENTRIAKQLGSAGGKKSVETRFKGKSKKEISEIMSNIRRGLKKGGIIDEELVKNLIKYGKNAGLFICLFVPFLNVS